MIGGACLTAVGSEHSTIRSSCPTADALLLVAEAAGRRIGIRALNRHVERVFEPSGKKHHWGHRKLARDR
jgi:hypothetical protein